MKKLLGIFMVLLVGFSVFAQDYVALDEKDMSDDVILTVLYNTFRNWKSPRLVGGGKQEHLGIQISRKGKIKNELLPLVVSYKEVLYKTDGTVSKTQDKESKFFYGKYEDDFGDLFYSVKWAEFDDDVDGDMTKSIAQSKITDKEIASALQKIKEEFENIELEEKRRAAEEEENRIKAEERAEAQKKANEEAQKVVQAYPKNFLRVGSLFEGTYAGKYTMSIEIVQIDNNNLSPSFIGYLTYKAGKSTGSYYLEGEMKNSYIKTEPVTLKQPVKGKPVKIPFGVSATSFEGETERLDDNSISWKGHIVQFPTMEFEGKWKK